MRVINGQMYFPQNVCAVEYLHVTVLPIHSEIRSYLPFENNVGQLGEQKKLTYCTNSTINSKQANTNTANSTRSKYY
jgi:hypothetical protein